MLHALFVADNRHHVRQPRDLAFALDNFAGNAVRHHDAVLDDGAFLHLANNRAACHLVAGFTSASKPHSLSRFRLGTSTPRVMCIPYFSAMTVSGR